MWINHLTIISYAYMIFPLFFWDLGECVNNNILMLVEFGIFFLIINFDEQILSFFMRVKSYFFDGLKCIGFLGCISSENGAHLPLTCQNPFILEENQIHQIKWNNWKVKDKLKKGGNMYSLKKKKKKNLSAYNLIL